MRDIQLVLERWGVWARDNTNVDYSHIAAGFKGLFPPSSTSKPSCCDDDGIIIDAAITRLKVMRRPDELQLLILHYVYGMSKRSIGRMRKTSEGRIRQEIMLAESFVDGCWRSVGDGSLHLAHQNLRTAEKSSSALRKKCISLIRVVT
ncbi:TPA: antiterminator Q family protein [Serratia fonticola]